MVLQMIMLYLTLPLRLKLFSQSTSCHLDSQRYSTMWPLTTRLKLTNEFESLETRLTAVHGHSALSTSPIILNQYTASCNFLCTAIETAPQVLTA